MHNNTYDYINIIYLRERRVLFFITFLLGLREPERVLREPARVLRETERDLREPTRVLRELRFFRLRLNIIYYMVILFPENFNLRVNIGSV